MLSFIRDHKTNDEFDQFWNLLKHLSNHSYFAEQQAEANAPAGDHICRRLSLASLLGSPLVVLRDG